MLILLPLITFILLYIHNRLSNETRRESLLVAAIGWGVLVVLTTELLSLFSAINIQWFSVTWSLIIVLLILLFFRRNRFISISFDNLFSYKNFKKISFLHLSIILIILFSGLIAFMSPPNTGDSLTYHMSRVQHWIQNQRISHYPTNILRQLHLNPFAEYVILQFQVLSGGDRFANFVQWLSMVGSIIGISYITKLLGGNKRVQLISAVIVSTIPMGILQSSSTQNDYVVTFWLVCFVYYLLHFILNKNTSHYFSKILLSGLSLGLAILTKGTAYIYATPFLIWMILSKVKSSKKVLIKVLILLLSCVLLINSGHYLRNYKLYGSPLGSVQEGPPDYKYSNDIFTLNSLISNTVRNIGLHLGVSNNNFNLFTEKLIISLHKIIRLDVNDFRTTWGGSDISAPKFHITYLSTNEDTTGNFFHLLLIFFSIVIILKSKYLRKNNTIKYYLIVICLSFLLFSFLLRWQSYHSRLHLPIFVLWSPLIAMALSVTGNRKSNFILLFLILTSFYWILFNNTRPFIGKYNIFNTSRTEQYFIHNLVFKDDFGQVVSLLKTNKCNQLGIKMSSMEYPLWVLMKDSFATFRLEHIEVDKVSNHSFSEYPLGPFNPCALLYFSQSINENVDLKTIDYSKLFDRDGVVLFIKK